MISPHVVTEGSALCLGLEIILWEIDLLVRCVGNSGCDYSNTRMSKHYSDTCFAFK